MESRNSCEVCRKAAKKYRCPKCSAKYCSVACYQSHQGDLCTQRQENLAIEEQRRLQLEGSQGGQCPLDEYVDDGDRVPTIKLRQLAKSASLKQMLANPHLRRLLVDLDRSSNPPLDMDAAMHEPIFVEFAEECMKIVGS